MKEIVKGTIEKASPVIPPDQAALVTTENGFELYIPDMDGDAAVPEPIVFLLSIMLRAQEDPSFVEEMTEWMAKKAPPSERTN